MIPLFSSLLLLLIALLRAQPTKSCPVQVKNLCACVDHVDGVLLNCTMFGAEQPAVSSAANGDANESESSSSTNKTTQQQRG